MHFNINQFKINKSYIFLVYNTKIPVLATFSLSQTSVILFYTYHERLIFPYNIFLLRNSSYWYITNLRRFLLAIKYCFEPMSNKSWFKGLDSSPNSLGNNIFHHFINETSNLGAIFHPCQNVTNFNRLL